MGKGIVVYILYLFLSALWRIESKLIIAACRDASVIRGNFRVRNVILRVRNVFSSSYVTNSHAATISLDSSLKRAERN
jgi:hypothetical protein